MRDRAGINKTEVFHSFKEWRAYVKRYRKDTSYHKYWITHPTDFPCIAIEVTISSGDLGEITSIEDFVYQTDFNQ